MVRAGFGEEFRVALACLGSPARKVMTSCLPEKRFGSSQTLVHGFTASGYCTIEIALARSLSILNSASRELEQNVWILRLGLELAERRSDLPPKGCFRAFFLSTRSTSDGNGVKVELQGLIPILLLLGAKCECFAALDTSSLLVEIEVLGNVVSDTVVLTRDVASNGSGREHWLVAGIVLEPNQLAAVFHDRPSFDQRNIAVE